jgi:GT2 family glycosyltransferase
LTNLDAPKGGYEIVIVDDGSPASAEIPALLESWRQRSPVPIRSRSLARNGGPCGARDAAWRMATSEWIAFTDDDCLPDRDWLVRLLESASGGADVVQGRTQPDPARSHLLTQPFARSVSVSGPGEYFHTCNILYRRSLLEALDGFDLDFSFSAEDTDLGWRARAAGATIVFDDGAVVTHDVVVGDWRSDLKGRRRWTDVVHMIAKHPAARSLAWKPFIYRRSHLFVFGYALALALLAPEPTRRGAAVALAALLGRDLVTSGSLRRAPATLQGRLADGYEVVLLLRESVRQRTVLL